MSAAATAAGYLYASGRLRGRGGREDAQGEVSQEKPREKIQSRKVRVATYQPEPVQEAQPPKPKRAPKIEYRTRRWTPNNE
jgi:hypothetical protein